MEFKLKKISFFHRDLTIICQNENGPCPLIAIANVLLLRGDMQFSMDLSFLSLDHLVEQIANQVFSFYEKSSHRLSPENMTAILNVLPNLAQGLDVNVSFNGVDKMEFTEQISLFDALNIPLLHGWVYDVKDHDTAEVIGTLSYNHLVYLQVEYRSLVETIRHRMRTESQDEISASLGDNNRKLLRDGRIVDRFMNQSATQLTEQGLLKLHDYLQDRQLFVFFRNNHFSTIFYFQQQLLVLATDLGYQDQPHVVWELLESVNGSGSEYLNSGFIPLRELPYSVATGVTSPSAATPISSEAMSPAYHTIAVPPVVSRMPVICNHGSNEIQKPMLGGGHVVYDSDLEIAMRRHLQENVGREQQVAQTSSAVACAPSGSMSLRMEQLKYLQQQQHHQQALQQVFVQQLPTPNSKNLSQRQILKGIRVESGGDNCVPPNLSAPESSSTISSSDLGMSAEELDQHTAMMIQYEEDKKSTKDRRRYVKRTRLRNRFLGLDENTGLDENYGRDKAACSIM